MGQVYENITLKNTGDVINVQRGIISEPEVRQIAVRALVDTGADTLIIDEATRQELGLAVMGEKRATLANEAPEICKVTEPVMIYWKDRSTAIRAMVLPRLTERLLGVIPLEEMDVIVNPKRQQLVGAHGDEVILKLESTPRSRI
jgi:clan AA aspartic protease